MRKLWIATASGAAIMGVAWIGWQTPRRTVDNEEFDSPIEAVSFRSAKRLSENGEIPDGALMSAVRQREELVDPSDAAGVFPGGWTWHGPGNIGGRVRAILIHPTNPNTMWTGGCSGGVWKTTDGGLSWAPKDDFMPVLPIGCMLLDRTNPDVLYIGTGEGFFETVDGSSNTAAVRGAGIFKSTDGGETWTQLPSTTGPNWYHVNRIAQSPTNANLFLAATNSGVWRSADSGTTWTRVDTTFAYDVQFHPTDGNRAVAGFEDIGVKFTANAGLTWSNAAGDGDRHRTEVRYARSNPNTVYAAGSSSNAIRIYRSTDGGGTFTLMTTGSGVSNYQAYNNVLWVDPTNPNYLIVGGVNLYRSTNGGASFTSAFGNVHADHHAIVEEPGFNGTTAKRIFFGGDGGIYRANDYLTNTVSNLNKNLGITQFYGAVMNPANNKIVGGTQDNGTLMYTGNPQAWTSIFGGDGVYCEYDPTDPNYWYGGVYYAQIFRSTSGGPGGSTVYSGITDAGSSSTCNFIAFFGLDPQNANTMLVGARSLWRSTNIKAPTPTWTAIKPTIQPRPGPGSEKEKEAHFASNPPWNISTFAVAQGNSDIIWVGYNNGEVWRTSNGTAALPTWTQVDNGPNPLPARWVGSIRIDPNNHNRVLVAFMGYDPDNLWETSNAGGNWTDISGPLPSAPISAVTSHPARSDWLYVGTDVGLFTSSDGGINWTAHNQGPGIVPIEELRWVTGTKLLAVTHGRGAYTATVANALDEPMSPYSFDVVYGTLQSGRLSDLYGSDDRRVVVSGDFSYPGRAHPVGIEFATTSPIGTLSSLTFTIESSTTRKNLGQNLFLWNYSTSQWEKVDFRATATSDQVATLAPSGDPNRFLNPVTREMKARAEYEFNAADTIGSWSARVDLAMWTIRG